MKRYLRACSAAMAFVLVSGTTVNASNKDAVLAKATEVFGQPLNADEMLFSVRGNWVVWLTTTTNGEVIGAQVGPKSLHHYDFPDAGKHSDAEFLNEDQYLRIIGMISRVRDIGAIRGTHGHAVSTYLGQMNTDWFERAFVERIVQPGNEERINEFDVYFLEDTGASPEQIVDAPPASMVCIEEAWFYLPTEQAKTLRLGEWQKM